MKLDKRKIAAQSPSSCWADCETVHEVHSGYGLKHSLDSLPFTARGPGLSSFLYDHLYHLVTIVDPCEPSRELFFHAINCRHGVTKYKAYNKERVRLRLACRYFSLVDQCAISSPYEVSNTLDRVMGHIYSKHMADAYELERETDIRIRKGEYIAPVDIKECRVFAKRSVQALTEGFERYFLGLLPHYDSDVFYAGRLLTASDL